MWCVAYPCKYSNQNGGQVQKKVTLKLLFLTMKTLCTFVTHYKTTGTEEQNVLSAIIRTIFGFFALPTEIKLSATKALIVSGLNVFILK